AIPMFCAVGRGFWLNAELGGRRVARRNPASIADCRLFSPTRPAAVFPAIGDNHRDDLLRAVPRRCEGLEYGAAASEHVAPLRINSLVLVRPERFELSL